MIVLDTTVLVYAIGGDHPLRAPSRLLMEAIGEGTLRATTTPEVIQELLHVRARRTSRATAAELAGDFATLLSPLLITDDDDLREGLEVFTSTSRLGAFDSLLAGAVRRRGARLVSADRGFDEVDELDLIDLGAPDVIEQL